MFRGHALERFGDALALCRGTSAIAVMAIHPRGDAGRWSMIAVTDG